MKIRQGILKLNDLSPDGVRIIVNWDNMVTSSSVFILCTNTQGAIEQAKITEEFQILDTTFDKKVQERIKKKIEWSHSR